MEDLLKQIIDKLDSLGNKVDSLDNRVNSLNNKVDSLDNKVNSLDDKVDKLHQGQTRIEKKLDDVYDQTADLTEFRTSTNSSLAKISKDVIFIKHKLHQNEEEIFDIKSHIKIVK